MKGLTGLIILSLLLCVTNSTYSMGVCKTYTIVDGLAGGNIRAIAEDKEGNLWIATDGDGVSRYNGQRFQKFTTMDGLPSNYVRAILEDGNGNLWFATGAGICKYDGKSFGAILNINDGLVDNYVISIAEDKKGNLCFGTKEGGISKYDGTKFENFTTKDGLAHDYVTAIIEDNDGNLWFGTRGGGISRYDGEKFTNFAAGDGLAHDIVWAALKDSAGNLWFGTGGGLSKYDGAKFENFTTENGLVADNTRCLMEDSAAELWIGTVGGVSKYDGSEFENFTSKDGLVGDNVTAICESSDGNLWFGTWGHGISKCDNRIQHYLKDETIEYSLEDSSGNLWFGAEGGDLFRYDGRAFQDFTDRIGLISNEAPTIMEDKNGNLWFTGSGGMTRYDGVEFQKIRDAELRGMLVEPIFSDSQNNIWFSIWRQGDIIKIGKYDGRKFQYFPVEGRVYPSGAGDEKVLEDRKGNIWFVTEDNSVYRYDGGDLVCFTMDDGMAGVRASSILEDKAGNIWFGIRENDVPDAAGVGGLSMYTGEFSAELKYQTDLDTGNIPVGLKEAFKNNGFSFSQDAGVVVKQESQRWLIRDLLFSVEVNSQIDSDDRNILAHLRQAFIGNGIVLSQNVGLTKGQESESYFLLVDRDNKKIYAVWVNDDKFHIYDNRQTYVVMKGKDKLNICRFTICSVKDGLCRDSVTGILEDSKGKLWFRTYHGGVSRYDGESFRNFTTVDGLTSNTIRSMLEDNAGKLWFGTQGAGISQYDGKYFQTLTKADGLINNTAYVQLADSRGDIWIRYDVPGLTRYTPRRDVSPRVVITQIAADRVYQPDQKVEVRYNTRVVFQYKGLSLSQFGNMLYDCRLEGWDYIQNSVTREREQEYENLKPGIYKFQVKTIDRDLNYSAPQSIEMAVLPPFYMDPLSIALFVFILIVLFVALIKLRSSRKTAARLAEELRQNREREEQRLREELQKAHDMQMNLMSGPIPKIAGFEVYGRCRPADEVGGDFFRFITSRQENDKFAIALIDVCGKGMKAAWIALMADGMLHFLAKLWRFSTGQLLHELNNGLYERITDRSMYVAFCFSIVDLTEKTLQFSNTGQRLPIIRRGEDLITIEETSGLLLGVMPGEDYTEMDIKLREGDIILFYTDGITEAANTEGGVYETERLEDVLRKVDPGLSAKQIADEIFKDVYTFMGDVDQEDDMTVVVLKVNESGGGDING